MNRTRKKYSVSGALDHSISPNDPSDTSNLKRLSSNILNYIKLKGNKYHNLSNKTKESKFNTNIEEKEKKNKDKKNIGNFHILWNTKSKSHEQLNKLSDEIIEIRNDNLLTVENQLIKNKKRNYSAESTILNKIKEKIWMSLEKGDLNLIKKENQQKNNENKEVKIQTLFKRYYHKIKIEQLTFPKYYKLARLIKYVHSKIKDDKKKLFEKLKKIPKKSFIKEIIKNLNYHKPIIKQKIQKERSASLDYICCNFPPLIDEDSLSVQEEYSSKYLDIFSNKKIFEEIEYSKEQSFYYKGRKHRRLGSDEIIKYKRLYEMAEESLSKAKNEARHFGYTEVRKKIINLNIPPSKRSSFKELQIGIPENCKLNIEGIKEILEIENIISNFEIFALKKNPYLWAQLPFTIKKLVKNHFVKNNSKIFFNYLKENALIKKQDEILIKILKNEDLKIKKKYFKDYNFRIKLLKFLEEREKEKISNYKQKNEILFDIERNTYEPSVLSDSFSEMKDTKDMSFYSSKSDKVKRNKKNLRLDYISKQKNPIIKIPRTSRKSKNNLIKGLLRKERMRNRKLNYIDRNDERNSIMNSSRKYKPIKLVKKVYDDVTGSIIQFDMKQPSEINNSGEIEERLLTNEEIKAEEILNEDKTMKMKRVLQLNYLGHFFKHWKFIVIEKNKKPKFFDVINIMMKCLFTNNIYVKAAFMGEIYFIKGINLFKWYWNVFGERKKREKNKKSKK